MNPKESTTYIVGSSDETSHYWQDLAVANRKVAEDNQTRLAAAQDEIAELKAKYLTKFAPDWANYRVGFDCGYAEAQEQAAKVCDGYAEAGVTGAMVCAAAIRAMKVEK